jgi:hypothetical protein
VCVCVCVFARVWEKVERRRARRGVHWESTLDVSSMTKQTVFRDGSGTGKVGYVSDIGERRDNGASIPGVNESVRSARRSENTRYAVD